MSTKKQEVDAVWEKYDVNKNGVLDKDECMNFLRDTFKEVFGDDMTDEQLEGTFKMIDEDGSGGFSKEEVMKHIAGLKGEMDEDDMDDGGVA